MSGSIDRTELLSHATPDDGERVGANPVWDEQDRPTLAVTDPHERFLPHDAAMATHLVDVHDMLRGELEQIRLLVGAVLDGRITPEAARAGLHATTLRQHAWNLGAYCAHYCRVVTGHHSLEDAAVFPHLRRSDAALGPVLDRLEQEHGVIHEVIELLDREIVRHDQDRSDAAPLAAALDSLTDALRSHLSYEERELLVPIARHGLY